jgi:hypothetical protein
VPVPVRTPTHQIWLQRAEPENGGIKLVEYPPHPEGLSKIVEHAPASVGFVRDFIKIPTTLPGWSWIPAGWQGRELWPWVFNVADVLLVCGVGVLAVHLWRDRRPRTAEAGTAGARGGAISVDSPDKKT